MTEIMHRTVFETCLADQTEAPWEEEVRLILAHDDALRLALATATKDRDENYQQRVSNLTRAEMAENALATATRERKAVLDDLGTALRDLATATKEAEAYRAERDAAVARLGKPPDTCDRCQSNVSGDGYFALCLACYEPSAPLRLEPEEFVDKVRASYTVRVRALLAEEPPVGQLVEGEPGHESCVGCGRPVAPSEDQVREFAYYLGGDRAVAAIEAVPAPSPLPPEVREAAECTGIAASWCPVHGNCSCPRDEEGARTENRFGVDCPLHGLASNHGDAEVSALAARRGA